MPQQTNFAYWRQRIEETPDHDELNGTVLEAVEALMQSAKADRRDCVRLSDELLEYISRKQYLGEKKRRAMKPARVMDARDPPVSTCAACSMTSPASSENFSPFGPITTAQRISRPISRTPSPPLKGRASDCASGACPSSSIGRRPKSKSWV